MDMNLRNEAERFMGYCELRKGQQEVIHEILTMKRDTLVLWATGQGKSLCYQLPALMSPNQTVFVVSPLISLMTDQVVQLNNKVGYTSESDSTALPPACLLGSSQTDSRVESDAVNGRYRLVYVTPEKLCSDGFISRLTALYTAGRIAMLAVDEAHCVSEVSNNKRSFYCCIQDHHPWYHIFIHQLLIISM